MYRHMLKSKIHRAMVTGAELDYEGSISLDKSLCRTANIAEYEKVDIYNINNGERFSTYVIPGKAGEVCLNGAAARKVQAGDLLIIVSYVLIEEEKLNDYKPVVLQLDETNKIRKSNI